MHYLTGPLNGPCQVKSGVVYEGIFHTAELESGVNVVLKMAKVVKDPAQEEVPAAKPLASLVIYSADLVQVTALDVRMGAADVGPVGADDAGGFGTDAAISRGRGGCVVAGQGSGSREGRGLSKQQCAHTAGRYLTAKRPVPR